ncbi:MAG: FMN-binding protein [Lachnospiraceae bacterium]|nr:FMN-binding protein [Lachnospiraceae bacterium]
MNRYFLIRIAALVVVLSSLFVYQTKAQKWEEAQQANQKKIAEVESYNRMIEQAAKTENDFVYNNGTFEGSAQGFGGIITVSVELEKDEIRNISIISAPKEDEAYLSMAKSILDTIKEKQSTEVDTISGATYSSTGLKNAVADALKGALK